jgi:hypothetical protein
MGLLQFQQPFPVPVHGVNFRAEAEQLSQRQRKRAGTSSKIRPPFVLRGCWCDTCPMPRMCGVACVVRGYVRRTEEIHMIMMFHWD